MADLAEEHLKLSVLSQSFFHAASISKTITTKSASLDAFIVVSRQGFLDIKLFCHFLIDFSTSINNAFNAFMTLLLLLIVTSSFE